jgi:uncharacterized protein (DUF2141 family)
MWIKSPIVALIVAMILLAGPKAPDAFGARIKHAAGGNIQGAVTGAAAGVTVSLRKVKKHHKTKGTATTTTVATTPKHSKKTALGTTVKHAKHHTPALMSTVTGANGSFKFTGLPPGEYKVKAHVKHQGSGKAKVSVTKNGTASVTLTLAKHHHKKAA